MMELEWLEYRTRAGWEYRYHGRVEFQCQGTTGSHREFFPHCPAMESISCDTVNKVLCPYPALRRGDEADLIFFIDSALPTFYSNMPLI